MNDSKVTPLEAQAVPTHPPVEVVLPDGDDRKLTAWWQETKPDGTIRVCIQVESRPTPAAADPRRPVAQMIALDDGLGTVILDFIGPRPPAGTFLYVAASPAAAAGMLTGWKLVPVEPTWDMMIAASTAYREPRDGHCTARMECAENAYRVMLASSPVAPVGAPTEDLEQLMTLADRYVVTATGDTATARHKFSAERAALRSALESALLSRQGCELATDATKQLGEHSVHPAATPIDQDFRRRPASSEAAPSADPTLEDAYAEGRADERQHWIDRGVLVDCPDCHGAGECEVYDSGGGPDAHSEIVSCPGCDGDGFARQREQK